MTQDQILSVAMVLLFGAIAGGIAGWIMGGKGGIIRSIVLGFMGAIVANWVCAHFGIVYANNLLTEMIVDVAGACVVIFVGNLLFK
jgi:uncharacterized membrane protein YeaQ/YmgE (transglycosylase-associated protein family)